MTTQNQAGKGTEEQGRSTKEPGETTPASGEATDKKNQAAPQSSPTPVAPQGSNEDLFTRIKAILPRNESGSEGGVTLGAVRTINSSNQYIQGDAHSQSSSAGRDMYNIETAVVYLQTAEDQRAQPAASPEVVFAGELESWWESGKPTMSDLCHTVALAFLEGSDFRSIAHYAARLKEFVDRNSPRPASDKGAPSRPTTTSSVIARSGGRRARTGEDQSFELVFFKEPAWRSQCLGSIWSDFTGSILPISDWLLAMALETVGPTRASLEQAIGILFARFPDDVYQSVILPLADAGIPQRWLAANSLGAALRADAAARVRAKLKAASQLSHGRAAGSVAALCVGTALARQFPADATDFLIALLEHHQDMDDALGVAIEGVMREARSSAASAQAVLDRLAGWPHWERLESNILGDLVAAYLQDSIEGPPDFANAAEAVRHFKRDAERNASAKKASVKFSDIAEILGVISAGILNPHVGPNKDSRDADETFDPKWQSVARFAGRESKVTNGASELIVRLLRFGPTRVTAWSLMRDLLRWSDDEQALGAVAIVKRVFSSATEQEQRRFVEHLHRWSREPAVRKTIEGYFQSPTSSPSNA